MSEELSMSMFATVADYKAARDAAEALDREHAQRLALQHHAADIAEELRIMTAGRDAALAERDAALAEMNAWSQIDDARNQRDRARTELTLQALSERDAARADAERLLDALKEIVGRIKGHPVYEELTPDEEIKVGGDTAELSYLARVADEAISAAEVGVLSGVAGWPETRSRAGRMPVTPAASSGVESETAYR